MLGFLFAVGAGFCALLASYFVLISRAAGMRKSRAGLSPGQKHGERLQDSAACLAFIASAAAIYALGVLPNQEVDENSRSLVLWILGGSWVLSMAHILFLICFVSDGPDGGNQEDKESPELVSK